MLDLIQELNRVCGKGYYFVSVHNGGYFLDFIDKYDASGNPDMSLADCVFMGQSYDALIANIVQLISQFRNSR